MSDTTSYAVVGCSNCDALWVVGDLWDQDTAACPSCGHTKNTDRLRALKEADDHAVACELRSRMLAARAVSNPTHDGFENLDERDQYATLAEQVEDYFATDENLYADQIETTEREKIVAEAADRAVEAHFEQFEYDVDTSWREEFGEAADRVAGRVVDDVPRQAGAGSFEVVDHQPLDTTATLRLDDHAPSETWQTLADDEAFRDALLDRARDLVRDARPAQYVITLIEAGVTAMDGAFARVLATALGGDESALSPALSAFGKGGVVEEIGVPAPSLDAVRDGPLALFALDDTDDMATVSVRIEPAFADRRADQRRALFELVEALADVVDVRLAVADDETMRWLLGEHAGDLPADVSEMCKEWLHTDNPASRERVGGALGDLEPDAPAVTTLRRIADAPGEARTYGSLYEQETDFPAGEGSENDTQEKAAQRVRTHLKRLRDHDLVTEGYQTNQGRAVAVTSTGLAYLSALRRESGALPEMPVAADPPKTLPTCRVNPRKHERGERRQTRPQTAPAAARRRRNRRRPRNGRTTTRTPPFTPASSAGIGRRRCSQRLTTAKCRSSTRGSTSSHTPIRGSRSSVSTVELTPSSFRSRTRIRCRRRRRLRSR
ncbi:hypothetical protein C2R22_24440 (plasmid) [Salinigranum rubrum]|uniref:DUF5817 domain-containing protein n=1 Tax=Salinigranum rubrum TaxID=755307 RepID=A0A2I8VS03_9EURY|nr:DUF5817 domain-containing protein [Salinigranum rubrum]AUV84682.1 hypothetical protein C2R22_24440 [Salinigranum rubrum]